MSREDVSEWITIADTPGLTAALYSSVILSNSRIKALISVFVTPKETLNKAG